MLIQQQNIALELYRLRNNPLSVLWIHPETWRKFARHNHDKWNWPVYRQADAEMYTKTPNRKFASRLASLTAKLAYEGTTLFAIQTGFYSEGVLEDGYVWSGVTSKHSAFTIRGHADYQAVHDHYLPDDDEYGYNYDDIRYDVTFVAAPTSIIK
jgi:hypothetical protein